MAHDHDHHRHLLRPSSRHRRARCARSSAPRLREPACAAPRRDTSASAGDESRAISQWLASGRSSDPEIIGRFYRQIHARVHAKLRRRGDDSRDVTQEVFLELTRRRDRILEGPREYAHGIAKLKLYQMMRRRYRRESESSRASLDDVAAEAVDLPSVIDRADQLDVLVGLLGELPLEDQRYVALIYGRGLRNVEVARRFGLAADDFNNELRRIRRTLQRRMLSEAARGSRPEASRSFSQWVDSVLGAEDDQ